tara:strand:- start:2193 stop:2978 length:786 start_codon:yes stop_codon:yes gene_type:complete
MRYGQGPKLSLALDNTSSSFSSNNNNNNVYVIHPRSFITGTRISSGAQGRVNTHATNNNKVVKLRTFKSNRNNESKKYRLHNKLTESLNNYYFRELQKMKNNKSVKINTETSKLIEKYPFYFLESLLQHKAGKANIAAKVHEIFATEEKSAANKTVKVHIYIVMDKLTTTLTTRQVRKNLEKRASEHGIRYQNGNHFGGPKEIHVMANIKSGKPRLVNFGNSVLLSNAEYIQSLGGGTFNSNIQANGPRSLTISRRRDKSG